MSCFAAVGIALPFFVYSAIPALMEIVIVVYAFSYWLALYLLRDRLSLSRRRRGLVVSVLICSGFFLIAIILDILQEIPQVSVYVSMLSLDFRPVYILCIGATISVWALRDLRAPIEAPGRAGSGCPELPDLPVTRREKEVIALILAGETNGSIAERLFISESTVKKHVNNIFRKLEIASRWELIRLTGGIHPKE
jgi:DNA-binding CsgD family transcriptional regulator